MYLVSLLLLDLSGNFINSFASNLLPSLKRINLANNKLETAELVGLLNLRYVHLSYNQLKAVPRFSEGSHIKVLSLEHNHIENIPPTISLLHNLSVLNLSHNSITLLPKELQAIEGLKEKGLDISHNSIQKVDCWEFMMRKATKSTI
jgi:Leucine-rich repeat (LRR) protein